MFRGSRPHRGGFRHPPPSRGFGPRPAPGHPRDRGHHPPPESYRRPSPRRRYSSPDPTDEYRAGRPQRAYGRYSPSPPRGGLPVDHSLVITVGNELTSPSGYAGTDAPYVRDYSAGESQYKKGHYSPRRSSFDEQSNRGSKRRSVSRGRSRGRSRSPGYGRSKSRPRSRSRSRSYSRGRSRGRSPEHAKSRARSKSRPRERSYSRSRSRSGSRSRNKSRARSRARSKSRPRSNSRERSRSRGRSRGRSRARSRSSSRSGSSSSSGSSRSRHSSISRRSKSGHLRKKEDFSELEKARRRKEIQDMLVKPAKSILKKRMDSSETDSPMLVQNSDSPRGNSDGGLSHEAEQLLCSLSKTMDPDVLASMLGKSTDGNVLEELIAKIQPARQTSDLTEFLGMIAEVAQQQNVKKSLTDIEDEEKFLYGDEMEADEVKPAKEKTESSYPETREHSKSPYVFSRSAEGNVASRSSATPELHDEDEPNDFPPGVGPHDVTVRKEVEEYEKIQDLLKTIGLDLGVAEISKMAARTQARVHGNIPAKKTPSRRQSDRKHRSRSRSSSSSSSSGSRNSSRSWSGSRSRSRSQESRGRHSRSRSLEHSSNRSSNRSKKKPVSPEKTSPKIHNQSKKEAEPAMPESKWPTTPTVGPATQSYPPRPGLSTHPMPPFPGPPPRGVMPPDYRTHGYNAYGNYIPYMPPGWPMYPPTGMPVPPPSQMNPYDLPNMERPFLKVIKTSTSESKTDIKKAPSKLDAMTSKEIVSHIQKKEMDDKNTASQKQKVTEELEKLRRERESRRKRKENLLQDVETLRKQQGELLRKKRREKDGHKDPLLLELGQLQEDAMAQISKLRAEQNEADQKHEELVKVALILGIDYRESKISAAYGHQQSKDSAKSPEKSGAKTTTPYTKVAPSKSRASPEKLKTSPLSSHSLDAAAEQFEYYDAGNHWCKNCNVTGGSMFDYFMHLHSKTHRKTLDPYDRPWAKSESGKKLSTGKRTSKPAKGSEFLVPVRGFFCLFCEEFFGDPICAEAHVTSHSHNERYKTKMYENPLYEQRRKLDRQAGLESQKLSELKRKREDDEDQDDAKKSKYSKEGKFSSNAMDTKPQYSKEEEYRNVKENENKYKYKEDVDKLKYSKEDDERAKIKKEEEAREKARYKKDDDERYSYRYRKEDGEKSKYDDDDRFRNKDDDEHYRYREDDDRYKFRKDDDRGRYAREEERSRYDKDDKRYKYTREAEEKSKYKDEDWGKWLKSKWDEDQESSMYEKKQDKSHFQKGKAGSFRDDKASAVMSSPKAEPEKPNEPPKILCGPSPALLAKLRKKNEDATGRPGFGKFGLKKPQKTTLEKEAERMAAQFIKEDEVESKDEDVDPFTKSLAAAKTIAIKLTGKAVLPPSGEWLALNENKSISNLPPPPSPMVIRKSFTGVQNKPTQSALSDKSPALLIGPQRGPELSAELISKAFSGEEVQLKQKKLSASPVNVLNTTVPLPSPTTAPEKAFSGEEIQLKQKMPSASPVNVLNTTVPLPSPSTAHKKAFGGEDVQLKQKIPSASPVNVLNTTVPPPSPSPAPKKAFGGEEIQLKQKKLSESPVNVLNTPVPLPSPSTAPKMVKPSQVKPVIRSECVITLDVAAPGVPKDEQKQTVILRPPPQFQTNARDQPPKMAKPKTLAAGKAKDLFNIFYSGGTTVKASVCANVGNRQDLSCKDPNKDKKPSEFGQGKELPSNVQSLKKGESVVAKIVELPKKEDSNIAQNKESKNEESKASEVPLSKEPLNNEDDDAQSKESSKNKDIKVTQSKEPSINKNLEVAQSEEPLGNEDVDSQSKDSLKNEDIKVTPSEEPSISKNSEVAQSEEPLSNKDVDSQSKESIKTDDFKVMQSEESTINDSLEMAQSNRSSRSDDFNVSQGEDSLMNEYSDVEEPLRNKDLTESEEAQIEESLNNEDSEVVQCEESPKNLDFTVSSSEDSPMNELSEIGQSEESPNHEDSEVIQSEESPKNEDLTVSPSEGSPMNEFSDVAQSTETLNNKDSEVVQSKESPKNEDLTVSPSEDSPMNEFSDVAQSTETLNNKDSEVVQSKESPKNEDLTVSQSEGSPMNEFSDVALRTETLNKDPEVVQSEDSPKTEDPKVEQAILNPEKIDSNEEEVDDPQGFKSIEIDMGDVTDMEVNSVDTLLQTNNEETPLDSEEPMSFSPLPGSFTEQLNLDTFEFSFEPL